MAPSMISFAAGQAAFTWWWSSSSTSFSPIGWRVGLTRIEDVAIGCGVSIVVGFLFWPRGATAALGRALSAAFRGQLGLPGRRRRPVDDDQPAGRHRSQPAGVTPGLPHLDDAFRQFFAERGAKVVSVETISRLFTGSNRLRLGAFTLATFPVRPPDPGRPEVESVAVAEAVLRDSYAASPPLVRAVRRRAGRPARRHRRASRRTARCSTTCCARHSRTSRAQRRSDRVQTHAADAVGRRAAGEPESDADGPAGVGRPLRPGKAPRPPDLARLRPLSRWSSPCTVTRSGSDDRRARIPAVG